MKIRTTLFRVLLGLTVLTAITAAFIGLQVVARGRHDTLAPSLRAAISSEKAAEQQEFQVSRKQSAGGAHPGHLQQASSGQAKPFQQSNNGYSSTSADQSSADSAEGLQHSPATFRPFDNTLHQDITLPKSITDTGSNQTLQLIALSNQTLPDTAPATPAPDAGRTSPARNSTTPDCSEPVTSWTYNRVQISYSVLRNIIAHFAAFGLNVTSPEARARELCLFPLR